MPRIRPASLSTASSATHIFLQRLPAMHDLAELELAFGEVLRRFGFAAFVLGQIPSVGHARTNFRITNYPLDWVQTVYAKFRYGDDPALDALSDADAPYLWQDLPDWKSPNLRQAGYIATSHKHGFSRGYTVPLRTPGEPVGAVSVATSENSPVPMEMLPFVDHLAMRAYKRARDIVAAEHIESHRPTNDFGLEQNELAALRFLAQGKDDYLIARVMKVSQNDVRLLLDGAQQKLGMRNRMSLAIRALELGFITYNDALIG